MVAADVRLLMQEYVRRGEEGSDERAQVLAARAGLTKRTVNRHLEGKEDEMALDTADRLLVALGKSLDDVRLIERG